MSINEEIFQGFIKTEQLLCYAAALWILEHIKASITIILEIFNSRNTVFLLLIFLKKIEMKN